MLNVNFRINFTIELKQGGSDEGKTVNNLPDRR